MVMAYRNMLVADIASVLLAKQLRVLLLIGNGPLPSGIPSSSGVNDSRLLVWRQPLPYDWLFEKVPTKITLVVSAGLLVHVVMSISC
jgi:hypothetical protein